MQRKNDSVFKTATLTAGALVLATTPTLFGADTPAAPGASVGKDASAGLLNDWFRAQSDTFMAWDIGGQVRMRYELSDGGASFVPARDFQADGVDNHNAFLIVREKLHVGYTPCEYVTAYVEGRDSSSSGDDAPTNPSSDQVDLHQAYVVLGNEKQFPVTLKAGRQEMIYGDERLVGASDWTNTQRVFDAAKLRYEQGGWWVDAFSGRVVLVDNHNFNVADDYDWFSGVYASTKSLVPWQETQAYLLTRNSGVGASVSPRDIYTLGFRVKSLPGKLHGWDYAVEQAFQLGSVNLGGVRLHQEAMAASVGGGYTWEKVWATPRLGFEYDYSSGDSNPKDNKSETFDNLFPTNHKHYGTMDFVGWRNVHNPRLSASAKPLKSLTVALDWHWFFLADNHDYFYPQSGAGRSTLGYGRNSQYGDYPGSELDFEVAYAPVKWGALRAGYGHFFPGGYVDASKAALGGAKDADWFYTQLTFIF